MITELIALVGIAAALDHKQNRGRKKSHRSYDSYDNYSSSRHSHRRSSYDDALAWQHDHSDLGI